MTQTKIVTRYSSDQNRLRFVTEVQTEGAVHTLSDIAVDLQDRAVRAALVEAGWTPPAEDADLSRLKDWQILLEIGRRADHKQIYAIAAEARSALRIRVERMNIEVPIDVNGGRLRHWGSPNPEVALLDVIEAMRRAEEADADE